SLSSIHQHPALPTLFPYTTLFRSISAPNSLKRLAHPARFELTTSAFGGQRSIQLSYGCQRKVSTSERERGIQVDECRRNCVADRSEEHTSELQSLRHLVCRLLLEK